MAISAWPSSVRMMPMMEGDSVPARLPTALMAAMPAALATPFQMRPGSAQNSDGKAWAQMAAAVLAKAEGDSAFRATVDAAARQVLTAKRAAGLLPC